MQLQLTSKCSFSLACGGLIICASSAAAATERIKLTTGEILVVDVLSTTETTMTIQHPVLGELTLPRAAVTVLAPEEEPPTGAAAAAESKAAAAAAQAPPPPAPPEPPPPPPKEWKFKLVLAAGLSDGNTENGNFTGIFTATRETPELKTILDTGYFFAQSNGDRSENRFTIGGRNDWLNPDSRWFFFADARYDVDEFQSWDSRVNTHVGIGYRLIKPPKLTLNLLGGIGAVKEFGSDNDDVRPEGLVGVEGKYEFAEKHSVTFSSTYYPDLSELGEYRWVNTLGWSFLIDKETKLSLTAGLLHEYQSQIDPGREHNDLRLIAGVQLDF